MSAEARKMLMVFVDETDMHGEIRLYEAIVRTLERGGVAGATALKGIMSFGEARKIHRQRLLGASDDRPIVILAVDAEERLASVAPAIRKIAPNALLTMLDVAVL